MQAKRPWVKIHFPQNRLLLEINLHCYEEKPFARGSLLSIDLPAVPAESGFTKHTKVKLSRSAWRMSVKAQLTCTLALQQLGCDTHTDPLASLLFDHIFN